MKKVLILSAPLSSQGSPDHSLTTVTLGFGTGQWTIRFWCSSSRASPLRAAPDKPWPGGPDTGSVPPPGSHGNRGAQPRRHPSLGPNHSSRGSSPRVMATREFARTSASYSVPIFLPRLSDTPPPPIACGPCEGKAAVWLLASNVAPIPGPRMGRLGRGARQAQDGADAGGARRRHAKGAWPAEVGAAERARWRPASDLHGFLRWWLRHPGRGFCSPCRPPSAPRPRSPRLPFLPRPRGVGGGRPGSRDSMSDSEEESQDRQLKIVVLGDGTSGKVSPGRARRPRLQAPGAALDPAASSPPPWGLGPGPARSWPGAGREAGAW